MRKYEQEKYLLSVFFHPLITQIKGKGGQIKSFIANPSRISHFLFLDLSRLITQGRAVQNVGLFK